MMVWGGRDLGVRHLHHRGYAVSALALAMAAGGCRLDARRDGGSLLPLPRPFQPTPAAMRLLEKGRSLFDQGQYELAQTAFEGAAQDSAAAAEALAYVERIKVLLGQSGADSWVVEPRRADEPVMAARLAVEVRFLLNEARRLMAENRLDEAALRLRRAHELIAATPLARAQAPPPS